MKRLLLLFLVAGTALASPPKSGPKFETDRGTVGFLHHHLLSGDDILYPYEAAKLKLQGSGFYVMRLRPDGTVESVTVKLSTGHAVLDQNVTDTLKAYRFKPNTKGPLVWLVGFAQPATVVVKLSALKESQLPSNLNGW